MDSHVDAGDAGDRRIGRIPVRNLWVLMLYASEFTRIEGTRDVLVTGDIDAIPDLVARLLVRGVEDRLRRQLTRGYLPRRAILSRVRGRIDVLQTAAKQLLSRGEIACAYEDLTTDTPRNRLVRAALEQAGWLVGDRLLRGHCRTLATRLAHQGVGGSRPSREQLAVDQIGRNDASDRRMMALAALVFDLSLPTEHSGNSALFAPAREETWVRRLFEKAVLGFARAELGPQGYRVRGGTLLAWQATNPTHGMSGVLPRMVTDIIVEAPEDGRRLVIDTKFTSILGKGRFGQDRLKSGHLYQIYTYLRSQEGRDSHWGTATGLLLHPAVGVTVRESVVIQDHPIAFATVDLCGGPTAIRDELREILLSSLHPATWL